MIISFRLKVVINSTKKHMSSLLQNYLKSINNWLISGRFLSCEYFLDENDCKYGTFDENLSTQYN